MPAYDVYLVDTRPEGVCEPDLFLGRLYGSTGAVAEGNAIRRGLAGANLAPHAFFHVAQETTLSRLLTEWKDAGDQGFLGREDDYDALVMAADEDVLKDDATAKATMSALADLAEEQDVLPDCVFLDPAVFSRLRGNAWPGLSDGRWYVSRSAAFLALAQALAEAPP